MRSIELEALYSFNAPIRRKQPIMFGSHRERIFCEACNKHFKHLEDEACNLVEWMARGRSLALGTSEQDVLARWGAKTGYALFGADQNFRSLLPEDQLRMLRFEGQVDPLTWVGYGSWAGPVRKGVSTTAVSTNPLNSGSSNAYVVTLTFKNLLLKVSGLLYPVPGVKVGFSSDRLPQVFPRIERTLMWPPKPPYVEADYVLLGEYPAVAPG